jgi:hypothetical protein
MAIVRYGGGVSAISGSIAGNTYSHNKGGAYIRNRAIPTNPNTIQQQAVRGFMATLTSLWYNTLTAAQRLAWDTYAANVLLPNPLGDPRDVGGLAMYVRSNIPRLQAGLDRVDDAPTTFNLGDYTNPSMGNATAAAQTWDLTFDNTDDWANEDDAAMLVLSGPGQNQSINFFKGPYRFAHAVLGNATTAPTSPATVSSPFVLVAGQRVFGHVRVTRADGRLTEPFRAQANVGA